ncbi:unnamed protein product [Protopolystoma xenopodis]|uniref:Uncharacterized protein n=1 Tax=Protopolystoma xenopodis TaxID=117903 RepID=A0A448WRF4_9PLAT|nr:unnamed protein product [Protopolystoma xenopodis]
MTQFKGSRGGGRTKARVEGWLVSVVPADLAPEVGLDRSGPLEVRKKSEGRGEKERALQDGVCVSKTLCDQLRRWARAKVSIWPRCSVCMWAEGMHRSEG